MSGYAHLFSPVKIGGTWFRNRVFAGPSGTKALSEGAPFPSEAVISHLAARARGGAACVTCVGASVVPVDRIPHGTYFWDIYDPFSLSRMAMLAQRIHFYGAKASMELGIAGVTALGKTVSEGAPTIWGRPGRELTREDMELLAGGFADGAEAMANAGFDMVLLHFGHGLTVGQFLSPLTNKRADEYGGSLENRMRYPIEIIDRIRARVGRRILIEVRISGSEYEPGGIEIDEAVAFARAIENKVDLVQFSAGMHNDRWMTATHPTGFYPPIPNVRLAAAAKAAGLKVPVAAIGGIQEPRQAEELLASGKADVLTVVRGFIADPDFLTKAKQGRENEIVPCVKCLNCLDTVVTGCRLDCTVNPAAGMESVVHRLISPPARKKKVAVIGGGPAGMVAALTAASRGHEVVLYEKSPNLGGTVKFAEKADFKYPMRGFRDYLIRRVGETGIEAHTGVEATPELIRGGSFDTVLVAVGSRHAFPPIPGLRERAVTAKAIYDGCPEAAGAVIIGGGQVGCETALYLAGKGFKVTILEMRPDVAPDALPVVRAELLLKLAENENIRLVTGARCTGVTETGVLCAGADNETRLLPGELVVLAAGMTPLAETVDALMGTAPEVIPVGDCVRPATVGAAVRGAYYAAAGV